MPFERWGGDSGTKRIIIINESFTRLFNLELVSGDMSFLNDPSLVAISESYAKECFGDENPDRKSTRLNSSHIATSRMPSSA